MLRLVAIRRCLLAILTGIMRTTDDDNYDLTIEIVIDDGQKKRKQQLLKRSKEIEACV
jgi:hypothetical protein